MAVRRGTENVKKMQRLNAVIVEASTVLLLKAVKYRRKIEVQMVKLMNEVSYMEALKKVRGTETNYKNSSGNAHGSVARGGTNTPESNAQTHRQPPIPVQTACVHKCKVSNNTLVLNKANFVAFTCHTINVATQLKKKRDQIKNIVEAAGRFIDMRELKANQIHARLTANYDGENTQVGVKVMVLHILQWNLTSLVAHGKELKKYMI